MKKSTSFGLQYLFTFSNKSLFTLFEQLRFWCNAHQMKALLLSYLLIPDPSRVLNIWGLQSQKCSSFLRFLVIFQRSDIFLDTLSKGWVQTWFVNTWLSLIDLKSISAFPWPQIWPQIRPLMLLETTKAWCFHSIL